MTQKQSQTSKTNCVDNLLARFHWAWPKATRVLQMRMHKFVTDKKRTLGICEDLALRNGSEDDAYHSEPRGNVQLAQDFRPEDNLLDGSPLAFAT